MFPEALTTDPELARLASSLGEDQDARR